MVRPPQKGPKLWFLAVVACLPALAFPWNYPGSMKEPSAWAPILTVFALGLAGAAVKSVLVGIAVAVIAGIHPMLRQAGQSSPELLGQALVLLTLVLNLRAWAELYQSWNFRWRNWLALLFASSLAGGLAWTTDKAAGVQAAASSLLTLLLASHISNRHDLGEGPRSRPGAMLGMALLVPLLSAAFALAVSRIPTDGFSAVWGRLTSPDWPWLGEALLPAVAEPDWKALQDWWPAFLTRAGLGLPWWVMPIVLLWALWRALQRGSMLSDRGLPPVSWGLGLSGLLAVAMTLLPNRRSEAALVPWVLLLTVFLVMDLVQAVGDRLVLRPPEDRARGGDKGPAELPKIQL